MTLQHPLWRHSKLCSLNWGATYESLIYITLFEPQKRIRYLFISEVTETVFWSYMHIRNDLLPEDNRSGGWKKEILINITYIIDNCCQKKAGSAHSHSQSVSSFLSISVSPFPLQWTPPHTCVSHLCSDSIPRFAFNFFLPGITFIPLFK